MAIVNTLVQPVIRKAALKFVDELSARALKTEKEAEGAVRRLLRQWHEMEPAEKERVLEIAIAAGTAAVAAVAALRKPKKVVKNAKRAVKVAKNIAKAKKA